MTTLSFTLTAIFFAKDIRARAVVKKKKLMIDYFDCMGFRSKDSIIRELILKYLNVMDRKDNFHQTPLFSKLNQDEQFVLLVIDEIHLLKPDDILAFLDIAKNQSQISVLMVCREKDWERTKINKKIQ